MNRFLQSFLFTFLFGCLSLSSLHAAAGRDLARSILLPDTVLARSAELALTAAQREAVEREQSAFRTAAAGAFATTRRATDALADQLQLEPLSSTACNELVDQIELESWTDAAYTGCADALSSEITAWCYNTNLQLSSAGVCD